MLRFAVILSKAKDLTAVYGFKVSGFYFPVIFSCLTFLSITWREASSL